ncbi:hypothetical protein BCR34DRAFT_652650 [Clohesyomyces aquaticus]|uniref:Uncharacterized protein n=1 Tax=Clohesyomyces aquaticus TaxID=1231657 RepID=A0A1Y2A7Z3_9PLEO|nr:hypothetical protein BCR34DRAFT_652650 [Clohesyomyces aquaticus]
MCPSGATLPEADGVEHRGGIFDVSHMFKRVLIAAATRHLFFAAGSGPRPRPLKQPSGFLRKQDGVSSGRSASARPGTSGRRPQGGQSALPTLWIRFGQSWGRQLRFECVLFLLLFPQYITSVSIAFSSPKAPFSIDNLSVLLLPRACPNWRTCTHRSARGSRSGQPVHKTFQKHRAAERPGTVSPGTLFCSPGRGVLCFSQTETLAASGKVVVCLASGGGCGLTSAHNPPAHTDTGTGCAQSGSSGLVIPESPRLSLSGSAMASGPSPSGTLTAAAFARSLGAGAEVPQRCLLTTHNVVDASSSPVPPEGKRLHAASSHGRGHFCNNALVPVALLKRTLALSLHILHPDPCCHKRNKVDRVMWKRLVRSVEEEETVVVDIDVRKQQLAITNRTWRSSAEPAHVDTGRFPAISVE